MHKLFRVLFFVMVSTTTVFGEDLDLVKDSDIRTDGFQPQAVKVGKVKEVYTFPGGLKSQTLGAAGCVRNFLCAMKDPEMNTYYADLIRFSRQTAAKEKKDIEPVEEDIRFSSDGSTKGYALFMLPPGRYAYAYRTSKGVTPSIRCDPIRIKHGEKTALMIRAAAGQQVYLLAQTGGVLTLIEKDGNYTPPPVTVEFLSPDIELSKESLGGGTQDADDGGSRDE